MHTVRLLLATTEYDKQILEKRFHAVSHIHNVLVKHAKKCLTRLFHDNEYQSLKAQYTMLLKKSKLSKDEKTYKNMLSKRMTDIIRSYDLSEYSF